MKKTILSLFLILCGGCQLFADFQVAKDGIPFAEIIVPAEEPEPVKNAAEAFDSCVAELHPEGIFLHIGAADLQYFSENAAAFDQKYRELIAHIRVSQKKCQIIVVSLGNPDESAVIAEMNSHLKVIAESERCVFGNISTKRVWNPVQTKDVISFVYSTGFMRPLKNNHPIYDMVKILFGFEAGYAV